MVMAAQTCPHCGKPIAALDATFCAFCGRPLNAQPLPEGAFPPGMIAVPPIPAPPEGPPPPPTPPAPGAQMVYPPPGYAQPVYPPPGYAVPGVAPVGYAPAVPMGYAPGMRAAPAFSGTRATWIAIAVLVATIVFVFLVFAGERTVFGRFGGLFFADPWLVLVVPAAFWLGLARLPYIGMGRVWAEAIGINLMLSLAVEAMQLAVYSRVYSYSPLMYLTRLMIETFIVGLIASVVGLGLAAGFANWAAVRKSGVAGRAGTGALWWAIGGIAAANIVFFALGFWRPYLRLVFLLLHTGQLNVLYMVQYAAVAIVLVWYASWSTLRRLRQRVVAPGVPVAPGIAGMPGGWPQQ